MNNPLRLKKPLLCIFFGFYLFSCQKKDSPTTAPDLPPATPAPPTVVTPKAVHSISPVEGGGAIQVTIKGTGFSDTLSHDSVFFNGIKAAIVSADSIHMVATVPIGAGTGAVTVFVNGTSVTGPVFTYDSTYIVTTFAGSGARGFADGIGLAAVFYGPFDLVADANGNVYVTDNSRIRKITPSGVVSTFAGGATSGSADGTGASASFNGIAGIAIDGNGNLYVSDGGNAKIRKITPSGVVTTLAGSGSLGATDGPGATARFYSPTGLGVDKAGNVYVADQSYSTIRKITPAGVVSTFAGNGTAASIDGLGTAASVDHPFGVAVDGNGNVYVSEGQDSGYAQGLPTPPSNRIRKITPDGTVTTAAGGSHAGSADGTGAAASFHGPCLLRTDASDNVYIAEISNARVRMMTPAGVVTTVAGSGVYGKVDGPAPLAQFYNPSGVAIDGSGNVYIAEAGNLDIRKISRQ